jgi:hypothetical protein
MLSTMIFPPSFDTLHLYPERTTEIVEPKPEENDDDESSSPNTPGVANQ